MWKWIVNHNIWNKVVAAGIISAIAFFISFTYGLYTKVPFSKLFSEIFFYENPFWIVFLLFFALIILIANYNYNSNKTEKIDPKKAALQVRKNQFIESNTKMINKQDNLIYRYRTYFHPQTKLPVIMNLQVYCNLHTIPLELYGTNCSDMACPNSRGHLSLQKTQKGIESQLVHEWEKLNGN